VITIYHLVPSRSERVIWLMEELGLPYKLELFKPDQPNTPPPAAFREIHPMGKSPVVRDGDTILIESGAILEYIIHRHGGGRLAAPVDSPDYPLYLQWMHFAEGSAMTQFVLDFILFKLMPGVDPASPMAAMMATRSQVLLKYIDAECGKRPYFAGDAFTAADIMMAYACKSTRDILGMDISAYGNIIFYLDRIAQRPTYRKAMAIANPSA
jgi:glutathione S-transferase